MTTTSKPHVCFLAPTTWPILAKDTTVPVIGGAEVQQAQLARALAAKGHRVSMICLDYGQPDETVVDGVTVYKTDTPIAGVPVLRFFHPRLTSVWKALRRVDADIYYQRAAGANTGIVALYAKHHRKRFVYAAACDLDMAREQTWRLFQRRAGWRDRQLFFLGVRLADQIVVQHGGQAEDCARSFNRTSVVVPSCYDAPEGAHADVNGCVLWVSTIKPIKQPELFLELARRLPQLRFRMVGGPGGEAGAPELFARIRQEAERIPNLEFLGFVPHSQVEHHFNDARVVVNTSHNEGFPNAFLQAWTRGVPTVSFCNTGSTVEGEPVGIVVSTLMEMQAAVDDFMQNDGRWAAAGRLAQRYATEAHSIAATMRACERLFTSSTDQGVLAADTVAPAASI